jgi:hypothetical protein
VKGFHTFENSAHSPMLEEPQRTVEILRAGGDAGPVFGRHHSNLSIEKETIRGLQSSSTGRSDNSSMACSMVVSPVRRYK